MRNFSQGFDVAHLGQGVGGCFSKQQTGVRLHGRLPFSHLSLRHKSRLHTKLGKFTANQFDGGAKHGVRANHMITAFEQAQTHQ